MPKLKTNRGAAKRFRATKNKKFKFQRANRRHMMEGKSPKQSQNLRQTGYIHAADMRQVRQMLPYH